MIDSSFLCKSFRSRWWLALWIITMADFSKPSFAQEKISQEAITSKIEFEILETKVISWKPPLYHGWPTLARRSNGELLLAFSGGREKHVCPFGRLEWPN
ncbi:MAG: hypothetical protein ACKOOI_10990 [Pirellula sp.]